MRIVSLLPAATEIVCFLGHCDSLVGISHACDWPPQLSADLPRLTEPKVDSSASSAEIDESVRSLVDQGLGVYEVDLDRLAELSPDVVITQDQCEVCAVDLETVESGLADRVGGEVELVSLHPARLDDVFASIVEVAEALGCRGDGIVKRRKLTRKVDRAVGAVPRKRAKSDPPEVCFIEWLDPLMVAGHWIPEMVDRAGGRYPFVEPGEPSREIEFDEIRHRDPDVIVVAPCGMGTVQMRGELDSLTEREGWDELSAVRRARVHPVDGSDYFNRPGPRILDSMSILVRLLWPGEEHTDETAKKLFSSSR